MRILLTCTQLELHQSQCIRGSNRYDLAQSNGLHNQVYSLWQEYALQIPMLGIFCHRHKIPRLFQQLQSPADMGSSSCLIQISADIRYFSSG